MIKDEMKESAWLEVKNLQVHFGGKRGLFRPATPLVRVVDGVSFTIPEGKTLAVVGEGGSGKSTLGRAVLRLIEPTAGEVRIAGISLTHLRPNELRRLRSQFQMIFQNPYTVLNPRLTVGQILEEPLKIYTLPAQRTTQMKELLDLIGLHPYYQQRYPYEFSGIQRQRIAIARALASQPRFLVVDDPTANLDLAVQEPILTLLHRLQKELGLTYLFLTKSLTVAQQMGHEIGLFYGGQLVEWGKRLAIGEQPLHPYTQVLWSVAGTPQPLKTGQQMFKLEGKAPDPNNYPTGCRFHPRCAYATEICRQRPPELRPLGEIQPHFVACHHADRFV